MSERVYIMPVWLRTWHWINAFLMLVLIVSGISLHFASPDNPFLLRFDIARILHNSSGITLAVGYVLFLAWNAHTGNWRHYVPKREGFVSGLLSQNRYVMSGLFSGDRPPVVPSPERKFNVLQQLTYLAVMYGAMPLLILTGLGFFFPDLFPREMFGVAGLLPIAVTHYVIGYLLVLFLLGHIYMGTMGVTPLAGFRMVITGWHVEGETTREEKPISTVLQAPIKAPVENMDRRKT